MLRSGVRTPSPPPYIFLLILSLVLSAEFMALSILFSLCLDLVFIDLTVTVTATQQKTSPKKPIHYDGIAIRRSIAEAAADCIVGSTWEYLSNVVITLEWPNISETSFTGIFCRSSNVAAVWRRS